MSPPVPAMVPEGFLFTFAKSIFLTRCNKELTLNVK